MKTITLISALLLTFTLRAASDHKCGFACKEIPAKKQIDFGAAKKLSLDSSDIKILIWNIYKGKNSRDFKIEFPMLAVKSDILLLQEMLNKTYLDTELSKFNFKYNMAISFYKKNQQATGVVTGSRALINSIALRTNGREPIIKTPKTSMVSYVNLHSKDFKLINKKLMLLNIHGMNFTGTKHLIDQLKLTELYLAAHKGPIVYAGDFNTRNDERLIAVDSFMAKFGLKKVEFKNDDRFLELDHLYIRDLKVKKADLLTELDGSDHLAIYTVLSL